MKNLVFYIESNVHPTLLKIYLIKTIAVTPKLFLASDFVTMVTV